MTNRGTLGFSVGQITAAMLLILLLQALSMSAQVVASDESRQGRGEIEAQFDVGDGRKMYLECHGWGSPTVILEAGFRNSSGIWHISDNANQASVWDGVGTMTRVCAYDRPGTTLGAEKSSKSDPVPMPRTGPEIVHELHALLRSAHVPGPYILVAHSLGGIFSRLYASAYPDSIIGLVLVDAFPENIAQLLGNRDGAIFLELVVQVPDAFKDYKGLENVDLPELVQWMQNTAREKPLRPMPLVVLARGKPIALPKSLPDVFSEHLESAWRKGQLYLASLIPGSEFVVARESEHYIEVEQPELVVDAVRRELSAVRWGERH
jgi:pimeloyl-ACP methyl ester carboxylesterase